MVVKAKVKKCKAKDPKNCRYHGTGLYKGTKTKAELNQVVPLLVKPVPDPVFNGPVGDAMTSGMVWEGEKPVWWDEYVNKSESNLWASSTPVLLDVIDSPEGKVAVVWDEFSQADNDKRISWDSGMKVSLCSFVSVETGKQMGYLKASSITGESFKQSFGDDEFSAFRYSARYGGNMFSCLDSGDDKLEYENPELRGKRYREPKEVGVPVEVLRRKVWLAAVKSLGIPVSRKNDDGTVTHVSSYNVEDSDVPDDATVEADLKTFSDRIVKKDDMVGRNKYFETPFIDYSSVTSPLKGSGFGSALYVYTARMLGQRGQVLRGSGVQSGDAQKVWARFANKLPGRSGNIKLSYRGQVSVAPVLDFRD